MSYRSKLIGVAALLASLALAMAGTAADEGEKGKGKGKGQFVKVDLSTLPPGLAKQLMQQTGSGAADKGKKSIDGKSKADDSKKKKGKGGDKTISLSQAVDIAERVGKGEAVKADRKGLPGNYQFKVDVIRPDGQKSKILLSGTGKVVSDEAKAPYRIKADKKKKKGD